MAEIDVKGLGGAVAAAGVDRGCWGEFSLVCSNVTPLYCCAVVLLRRRAAVLLCCCGGAVA